MGREWPWQVRGTTLLVSKRLAGQSGWREKAGLVLDAVPVAIEANSYDMRYWKRRR